MGRSCHAPRRPPGDGRALMRVVGGTARGRRLVTPAGSRTRPTTDKVREAVFNALWSRGVLEGARVVDLFAGSGALGVEALSRGAARATFVDSAGAARRTIAANLATCGLAERARIVSMPVERFVARRDAAGEPPFDLAFCDPPYAFGGWDDLLAARPAHLVVAESGAPVAAPGWQVQREARYGAAWVGFLTWCGDAERDGDDAGRDRGDAVTGGTV